ncbi:peptidoglycan D,D-transpeptidase FtsI family protein [Trueperella sp. LYQ143]|uniref:peptidoglycan D,D-transpeptidase FtsI family protein n=1 Tax=unclassified Trueperella TaxID=2630174 RepID=UPI00398363E6
MNPPLRKLTAIVIVMFLTLMAAATSLQFFRADSLNADARNVRTLYKQYGIDRGPIIVAGEAITGSTAVDSPYRYQRTYSHGELYAPITGYFSVVYNSMTGMERAENGVLSGSSDELFGQRLNELISGKEPQGGGVSLTINPRAQQAAWDALGNQRGAVVAIEPETGKILALVSKPTFDPNIIASHDVATAQQGWNSYESDPAHPLENRAIGGDLFAPGSVFKLITASAMLESGITADTLIDAPTTYTPPQTDHKIFNPGQRPCGDGSGKVPLRQAFLQSCNTAFAIGGQRLGQDAMTKMAEAYGFHTNFEIPLETRGAVFPKNSSEAALAMASFGQQDVRVSPLQMAMVAAAIANNGVLMTPYLVDQTLSADLAVLSQTEPHEFSRPISAKTASDMRSMMIDVVNRGTGTHAALGNVQVAGKTGTAEISPEVEPHAWFAGFDATDHPRVAVAAFVENGGDGGEVAGPVARAVIEAVVSQ